MKILTWSDHRVKSVDGAAEKTAIDNSNKQVNKLLVAEIKEFDRRSFNSSICKL